MAKIHSLTHKTEVEGGGTAWLGFGRVVMGGSVNDKRGTTAGKRRKWGC